MNVALIQIGKSEGITLEKTLLEKYNIKDAVELILEEGYIIIKPTCSPRKGWDEAFKNMHKNGDNRLLIADIFQDEKLED